MNDLELMADSLFLPLSFYASLSDIKSRAIPTSTELMLVSLGILMVCVRVCRSGFPDPLPTMINNAPPLLLLLIFSILGKSGIGDLEYATSMALSYPGLLEARTFTIFPNVFRSFSISASVLSIALMNAILIAWVIIFYRGTARWLRERNFPSMGAHIATLAISILVPRVLILTPFFSRLVTRRTQSITNVPFIPLMFIGFVVARYANAILL